MVDYTQIEGPVPGKTMKVTFDGTFVDGVVEWNIDPKADKVDITAAGYTDLRAYRFDSTKTDQICIIQGGGSSYIVTGGDIEKPNIQIQVRDNNLANAEAKAEAIKVLLHKNDSITDTVAVIWDGRAPDYWADDN